MKRFFGRLLLWAVVPAVLCLAMCLTILYRTGELNDPAQLIPRAMAGEDLVVELTFSGADFNTWYKTKLARQHRAEVLVTGNSRTMQIRQCMLPAADFYNAGGAVNSLERYLPFLQNLEKHNALPKTLIITLDSYYFIDYWYIADSPEEWIVNLSPIDLSTAIPTVARRIGSGAVNPLQILNADRRYIGLSSCARSSGFSVDGSYNYGTAADNVDLTFIDAMGRITIGSARFEHDDHIAEGPLQQLDEILSYCDQKNIQVIAFLPPYAPTVYNAMVENGNYGYLNEVFPAVSAVFAAHPGHVVFDFTYMPDTTDEMYLDGFHGGDVVYAMMLKQMVQAGVLTDYTSVEILDELIASARSPRVIDPPAV